MQGETHFIDCLLDEILIIAPSRRAHLAGLRDFDISSMSRPSVYTIQAAIHDRSWAARRVSARLNHV
jgi:hypothetical protein